MKAAVGIDVGGTKLLAVALDERGVILHEVTIPSPHTREGLVATLVDAARGALSGLDPTSDLVGIGIGLPGLVDRAGVLHETPNLHAAEEMTVGSDLAPALRAAAGERNPAWRDSPLRVVAENDATCAAAGEIVFGAAAHESDAVVVTLGTGIGGGVISAGRLVLGERGFAGEIGHMVVVADGAPCKCGNRGCWEQYASGTGIARLAHEALERGDQTSLEKVASGAPAALRAEHVVAAAKSGDKVAAAVLDEAARYLALGFSNLAEILDPGAIVVSGGLASEEEAFIAPAVAHFSRYRRGSGPRAVRVVRATLGETAGAVGAGAFALGRC